jgi:hypothetical protein
VDVSSARLKRNTKLHKKNKNLSCFMLFKQHLINNGGNHKEKTTVSYCTTFGFFDVYLFHIGT